MFHSLSSLGWLRLSNEQFYSHFNKGGGREAVIKLSPFGSAAPVTHTNGEFWCQAGRHAQSTGSAAFPWGHAVSENTSRGQTVPELSSALLLLSLPSWGGSRCWGCEGDESLLQTCTHTSSCLGKSFVQRCFWPVLPISQLFYIIYNTSSLRVLLWGAFLSGSCGQAEKCCSVFQALVFHSHSLSCRQPALESTSFLAGSGSWLCFSGYTNQWTWRCLAGALMEPTPSTDSHWDALCWPKESTVHQPGHGVLFAFRACHPPSQHCYSSCKGIQPLSATKSHAAMACLSLLSQVPRNRQSD